MRRLPLFLALLVPLLCIHIDAEKAEIPPAPATFVTDESGFLSTAARETLEQRLTEFERQSGIQFIVYIAHSSGSVPIEDWAARAFEKWGIGKKGEDNGIALFIFSDDRRSRIEVGYGLEGQLPDAIAGRILDGTLAPLLRANANDEAVARTVSAVMAAATGRPAVAEPGQGAESPAARKLTPLQTAVVAIIVIGFLILLITNPSFALYLLFSILSGGRGGGGGGGGFRGGGGRSGGGGASGSW